MKGKFKFNKHTALTLGCAIATAASYILGIYKDGCEEAERLEEIKKLVAKEVSAQMSNAH